MNIGDIFIEIQAVGNALRVAAVHADTGEELIFQVPKNTPRHEIDNLARAKVAWKLKRLAEARGETAEEKRPDTGSGRGITV